MAKVYATLGCFSTDPSTEVVMYVVLHFRGVISLRTASKQLLVFRCFTSLQRSSLRYSTSAAADPTVNCGNHNSG